MKTIKTINVENNNFKIQYKINESNDEFKFQLYSKNNFLTDFIVTTSKTDEITDLIIKRKDRLVYNNYIVNLKISKFIYNGFWTVEIAGYIDGLVDDNTEITLTNTSESLLNLPANFDYSQLDIFNFNEGKYYELNSSLIENIKKSGLLLEIDSKNTDKILEIYYEWLKNSKDSEIVLFLTTKDNKTIKFDKFEKLNILKYESKKSDIYKLEIRDSKWEILNQDKNFNFFFNSERESFENLKFGLISETDYKAFQKLLEENEILKEINKLKFNNDSENIFTVKDEIEIFEDDKKFISLPLIKENKFPTLTFYIVKNDGNLKSTNLSYLIDTSDSEVNNIIINIQENISVLTSINTTTENQKLIVKIT